VKHGTLYNSAIKNGTIREEAIPTERFDWNGNIGARRNLVTEAPLEEIYKCDVIYAEPPWPHGLKTFDSRAGETTNGGYAEFARSFARMWRSLTVPRYVVVGKRLLADLPKPSGTRPVLLNGAEVPLTYWGGPEPEGATSLDVCEWLGKRFGRMGDPTAGYGFHLIRFCQAKPGNTFVGSDYDAQCVTILERLARENLS
jgi:hypothetical protein